MRGKRALIASQTVILLVSAVFAIFHIYTLAIRGRASVEDLFPVAAAISFAIILATCAVMFIADKLSGGSDGKGTDETGSDPMLEYLPMIMTKLGCIVFEYDCKDDSIRLSESVDGKDSPLIIDGFLSSLESNPRIHPSDVNRLREFTVSTDSKDGLRTIEIRLAMDGREYIWYSIKAFKVFIGERSKVIGSISNIHEMKEERQRLIEKANTDPLTGLYTRDVIRQKVNDFLMFRGENEVGTLFHIDVDNFKEMNDLLGHTMGDKVLVDFAQSLRIACPNNAVICRTGGDESAIFLPECGSAEKAKEVGEYIVSSVQRTYSNNVNSRTLSISMGAALTCESDTEFSQVYDRADKALSNAKAKGKSCFEIFDYVEETRQYETFPEWGIF